MQPVQHSRDPIDPIEGVAGWETRVFAWLERHPASTAAMLVTLALIPRLAQLTSQSLYLDEAFSAFVIREPVGQLLAELADDPNPPLYFLLLKGWCALFGDAEWALRLPSVLCSSLAVALLFLGARRHLGIRVAFWSALWLIASPAQIAYAVEARPFALVSLATAASLWSAMELLRKGTWRWAIALGATTSLLLHTHYTSYVLLLLQGLTVALLARHDRRTFLRHVSGQLLALVSFVPWLLYWASHDPSRPSWLAPPTFADLWRVGVALVGGRLPALFVVACILFGSRHLLFRSGRRLPHLPALALAVGPLALPVAWTLSQVWQPSFLPKYLLFASIGIVLWTVWAVEQVQLPSVVRSTSLVVLLVWAATEAHNPFLLSRDWRGAVAHLQTVREPGAAILLDRHYHALVVMYYLGRNDIDSMQSVYLHAHRRGLRWPRNTEELTSLPRRQHEQIFWLALRPPWPGAQRILARSHARGAVDHFGGVQLIESRRRQSPVGNPAP